MKKIIFVLTAFFTIIGINNKLFSQNNNITVTHKRNPDKSVDISYNKELPGSYYLKLVFPSLDNCYPTKFEGVIKNSSGRLIKLKPINSERNIKFSYTYSSIRGIPNPKVDSLFNYTLPFKKGKKVTIYEASNLGEKYFGSEKPSNWKSYIINSKSPDTVFCMRKGIVIEIINKFKADTLSQKSFTSKRNRIIVEHSDGTYASYTGFNKESISVKLGQIVYPQTQLGTMEVLNKGNYRLSFDVHYLIDNNLERQKKQTLKNRKSQNEYLTPYFITKNGAEKITSNKEYTVFFNETILFQELTRREKKKYKKNPSIFN